MSEPIIYQDSYTVKLNKEESLKVYLDMTDLKSCESKLKNFYKIKNFVEQLKRIRE